MSKELNKRERLFVIEYAVDQNGTRAAMAAGYSKIPKAAGVQAVRLLARASIAQAVNREIGKAERRAKRLAWSLGFTRELWEQELKVIAGADMDDYATVTLKKTGRMTYTELDAIPTAERDPGMGRAIKKITQTKHGISVELHSKQAALETLGRATGWLKDNVHLSGGTTNIVATAEIDEAKVLEALKKLESEI